MKGGPPKGAAPRRKGLPGGRRDYRTAGARQFPAQIVRSARAIGSKMGPPACSSRVCLLGATGSNDAALLEGSPTPDSAYHRMLCRCRICDSKKPAKQQALGRGGLEEGAVLLHRLIPDELIEHVHQTAGGRDIETGRRDTCA